MASIQKLNNQKGYRVQIKILGVRESKVFTTRREASEWAAAREIFIRQESETPPHNKFTLRDAMRKYANEIAPTHRGTRWERIRLAAFERRDLPLDLLIGSIDASHIALFRDSRLHSVKPGSILRELNLLSSVFEAARLEWRWIDKNPCRDIRRPSAPRHRDRTLHWREIKALLSILDYKSQCTPKSYKQVVAICLLTALRTGMRAGELCGLSWDKVHADYVHLPMTKNSKPRDVPLSKKAKKYIELMQGWDDTSVFGLRTQTLSALFRKYRAKADLDGFTWHDTRHTAATMLSKKLDVLDLCKMFGWSDPKMAMVYYNPHVSTIAALLD